MFPLPAYEPVAAHWVAKVIILWGSWLAWPLAGWLVWRAWRRGRAWSVWRWLGAALLAVALIVFIDARFVERYRIEVRSSTLQVGATARIALISDLHLGVYKSPAYLERVVDRLNVLAPDAVLIAGDFTYGPDRPLDELLAPLARLKMPVYSVPGNHDEESPGPNVREPLRAALVKLGVHPVEGTHADLGAFTLVGMGDSWAQKDGLEPVLAAPRAKPVVVLLHNPDSVMQFKPGMADLVLAGHTHGGQIRIPGLYRRVIPCVFPFDRGLHTWAPVPTFVSAGMGEVGLPLRLLNPPVIDLIELR